jgi:nucleotide-binding universal stress UspA family protein
MRFAAAQDRVPGWPGHCDTASETDDMATIEHVLFPYDFSPQGQHVAGFVRALADALGARTTILSVVPPLFEPVPSGMGSQVRAGDDVEEWKAAARGRLDTALVEELRGPMVDRQADYGDPALRIVDAALSRKVDLIMMPTHGLGLFRQMLIGSVAAKVLHDARCPVWTAAHAQNQSAHRLPRRILCAVDGTEGAASLMKWAIGFSAALRADLQVIHVVGPVSDWSSLESERRLQEQFREHARASLVSVMTSAGIDLPYRVMAGEIVHTVTEEARQESADLVVIGRGSVAASLGRLRTHAFGMIQRAPCPVLSV